MLYNIFSLFVYKQSHYGELVQEFLFSVTFTHTVFLNAFSFYTRLDISGPRKAVME